MVFLRPVFMSLLECHVSLDFYHALFLFLSFVASLWEGLLSTWSSSVPFFVAALGDVSLGGSPKLCAERANNWSMSSSAWSSISLEDPPTTRLFPWAFPDYWFLTLLVREG